VIKVAKTNVHNNFMNIVYLIDAEYVLNYHHGF
jgi:hypothetical protein